MASASKQFSQQSYSTAWDAVQDIANNPALEPVWFDDEATQGGQGNSTSGVLEVGDVMLADDGANGPSTNLIDNIPGFFYNETDDTIVKVQSAGLVETIESTANVTTTTTTTSTTTTSTTTTTTSTTTTTTIAPSISFTDTSNISVNSAGATEDKQFTIQNNGSTFSVATMVVGNPTSAIAANGGWCQVTANSNANGGTITFTIQPNTGTTPRDVDIYLRHPENSSVVSQTINISQSAGNALPIVHAYVGDYQRLPQGQNQTPKTLNFATGGGGWNPGTAVTDNEDGTVFGPTALSIVITDITAINGTLTDVGSNTAITSTPHTLNNNGGAPSVSYQPDAGFGEVNQVAATFDYKAVDSDGGESSETVTINVLPAANQAPVAQSASYSINGFSDANNSNTSIQQDIGALVTDPDNQDSELTIQFFDANDVEITDENAVDDNFTGGDIVWNNNIGFKTFTYTKKPNLQLGPNDPPEIDEIRYKVTDPDGEQSGLGIITLTAQNQGNTAPLFQNPTYSTQIQQWSSTSGTAVATDDGTGTLVYSLVDNNGSNFFDGDGSVSLNSATGEWFYEANYTLPPNVQNDAVQFKIAVTDGFASGQNELTVNISVTPTGAVAINYSAWVANSDEACGATKNNQGYLDTGDATDINQLAVDDVIYIDGGLGSELTAPNSNTNWIGISQQTSSGLVSKAIQIGGQNEYNIINIIECEVNLGNAWALSVNFDEDVNDLCTGNAEYGGQTVWQNISATATLADVVTAGGQIFIDEIAANTYLSNTAPAEFTASTGYYNDATLPETTQYYEFQQGAWTGPFGTPAAYSCPVQINYQTYEVGVYYNDDNRIRVDNACLADTTELTFAKLYFRGNSDLSPTIDTYTEEAKLQYLLQNNIVPFVSEEAANLVDYSMSWDSTTFLASEKVSNQYQLTSARKFAIWENYNSSGYTGNFTWKGVDPNDVSVLQNGGPNYLGTAVLGECSTQFERPAANTTYNQGGVLASRENVFYALLSCVASFEDGSPYWKLYIIDGLHKDEPNASSYLKELFDVTGIGATLNGGAMLECMTLQHKVMAVNIDDAQDILNGLINTTVSPPVPWYSDSIRTVQVNPVDLGFTSGATISYGYTDCAACLTESETPQTFTLATVQEAEIINTSLPNFDLEKNYNLDDRSKPLLRTNPKLSTNAKLVVNSQGKMYLESIEATKELASVEYKKYALNKDGQWSFDLHRFFKNTKTPADQIYQVKESYSNFAVQETFENQIEEDYHYGTVYNYSKIHDEDFRMLAPIWLDKNIPNKFVVFRVKDPVGTLDFDTRSNLDNIKEVLKNSEIVTSFDLSRDSELGTYLRNHIQSESFPKTPITMNFDKTQRSSFNGIDLAKGGFTTKGEYLDNDFIRQDSTLIAANQLITDGFQRNNLACANLINMEFLFNDDAAGDYSVSRYFGLYVDDIDSGYGTLESANTGRLKFKSLNSYINNDGSSAIPPYKLISETPTLGYASTSEKFYKISPKVLYRPSDLEVNVEDSANKIAAEIKLAQTGNSIDIKTDGKPGSDFVKVTLLDVPAVNDGFAIFPSKEQTYRLKFTRLIPQTQLGQEGWKFTIINPTDGALLEFGTIYVTGQGIQGVANYIQSKIAEEDPLTGDKLYPELYNNLKIEVESDRSIIFAEKRATLKPLMPDFLPVTTVTNSIARVEELQVPYDIDNNTFFALDGLPAGGFGGVNFSNQGTIPQITSAIVKSINSVDNGFTALSYDGADHFYIKTDVQGYRLLSAGIAIPNNNANQWISVDADNLDVDNLLRLDINEGSGNTINDSAIYYFNGGNATDKSGLVTLDSASDVNVGDFINTKSRGIYNKVIDIVDDIERLPLQYKKIVLEKPNTIESGEVKTYADNLVKLGLFSAYDIHDMNFDFYDTANSELKELNYETAANIAYEPEQDDSNDIYPFGAKDNTDYTLEPVKYFSGLSDILLEEQADTFDENEITSEFDRLQENYLKEYAIRSRVVPSINKWCLKDSLTVREQPYYLNANEAFGRSNFAPDLSADGRSRLGMTPEWFYINNLPAYFKQNQGTDADPSYRLNDSFSYINFMDGFEITPAIFKDTNYDYFDRFFVTEGFETKGDNNYKTFVKTDRQKKYTRVDGGNNTAFASTIFKGLKFTFKKRKEFTALSPVDFIKTSEFNGYRFSTLLNVKTAQESNGIEYEVIQNKKFKFVVFLITLSIDDLWADGTLNRKLLYELNHSLVWKSEDLTFEYSDVKIDGALNLQEANLTDPNSDDYLVVNGIQHVDGSMPQFLEQINKDEDSKFGNLLVKLQTPFGEMILQLEIAGIDGQDRIVLAGEPLDITNGVTGAPVANLQNIPSYLQSSAEYVYERGGINAYKSILDALSARDVATMLLREPNNVMFTTVDANGTISNNQFVINLEDGTEVVKDSKVQTIPDTDKPESFKLFSGNIGYDLVEGFTYYPFLVRQNGGYTVDTRPVVTFTDVYSHMKTNTLQSSADPTEITLEEQMYKHSLTDIDEINLAKDYYKRYNRCGVAFNLGFIYDGGSHDTAWGYIKNHFYRKVNEFNAASVTKLSTSTDKLPLYPLIGEVAIDKKDVHVFRSSWDKNYYTRSLSGGTVEQVPGTFETKEEKSYLASTIMKVKDSYNLLSFTSQYVNSEEEQDEILVDNTNSTDLVIFENNDRIVVDFYITDTIKDKLASDGVLNAIQQYVAVADSAEDKTTLVDDADLYIEENLVNLFSLNQIKLFTRRIKGQFSAFENTATIDALDDGGYTQDQNFTFRAHEQKPLNFRLIYNKRLGYSYRIRPMIKITS